MLDVCLNELAGALAYFQDEKYLESNVVLSCISVALAQRSFIDFCIGRNHLHLGDLNQAEVWLERSLRISPAFPWSYYELSRLRRNAGDLSRACQYMVSFSRAMLERGDASHLNEVHVKAMIRIAHESFDGGSDRDAAVSLYHLIIDLGVRDYLSELRLVEVALDRERVTDAVEHMGRLQASFPLEAWGFLVSSRMHFAKGEKRLALKAIYQAVDADPSNDLIKVKAANAMLSCDLFLEAENFNRYVLATLVHVDMPLADEIAGIAFRLAVRRRDHTWLLAGGCAPEFLRRLPNWQCVEALYTFARPGYLSVPPDADVTAMFEAFLETQTPYTLGTVLSLFHSYNTRRRWDKVERLENLLCGDDLFEHHAVVLRRFECSCAALRLDDAGALYRRYYSIGGLRHWESCSVLRYLAQVKSWVEVEKLLLYFFEQRYHLPDGTPFLLRLCRRLDCHASVLRIIETIPDERRPSQYLDLAVLLNDDILLRNQIRPGLPSPLDGAAISWDNAIFIKVAGSEPSDIDAAGVLCADKAYVFSVLTFLASVATHMSGESRITWYIFLATDVPSRWHRVITNFAAKIEVPVQVVAQGELVIDDFPSGEEYGIFTGGNTLSTAAFLRIYAVAYLCRHTGSGRAIYVDSDIVCMSDLAPLLDLPFDGALLLARSEEPSPEIAEVTASHRLAPLSYFNSGVLVFDLAAYDVGVCIERAKEIAVSETSSLVFHDQCALNIAFAGRTKLIDAKFNSFTRANRPDDGDLAGTLLLHFLDQPKPWNLSYRKDLRAVWWRYAGTVRVLLGAEDYNALVAAANYGA